MEMEIPPALLPLFQEERRLPVRRTSFLYRFGLLLAAVAMVILPLLYLGLTLVSGWGVYWFATHCAPKLWEWPGSGRWSVLAKIFCSSAPLIMGSCITLFLVKPFFARRAKLPQPHALGQEAEPLFRSFVGKICAAVGASQPREIRLDCDVNASAGYRRGMLSFFGSDLVLTVGMPLIAGLSTRQLAGVIAHEFGHFTQGAGMRLSYLIRRVNGWFVHGIHGRDSWDEILEEWQETSVGVISLIPLCAQSGVWVSRVMLRGLMVTGNAICSFLMRQMEYDADRFEIAVAGSGTFEQTTLRMAELSKVTGDLYKNMHDTWRNSRRVPDNVPVLIGQHAAEIREDVRAKIAAEMLGAKTGWLDTHPASADRIAAALRAAQPGIFADDLPARDLLENFHTLSRTVTLAHYADELAIPTTEDFLIPVDAVLQSQGKGQPVESAPRKQVPEPSRWHGLPVPAME